LTSALGNAVAGIMAMKGVRIAPDFMHNANLGGQVFDLARAGEATTQRMQALKVAAEARGLDTFTSDHVLDAEVLMTQDGLKPNEAGQQLVLNQTMRDVATGGALLSNGTANPAYSAALSEVRRGLFATDVAQRVQGGGYGPTLAGIAIASRPEMAGLNRGAAMFGGRQVMLEAMGAVGYTDPLVDGGTDVFIERHQAQLASAISSMENARVVELIDRRGSGSTLQTPAVMSLINLPAAQLAQVQALASNFVAQDLAARAGIDIGQVTTADINNALRAMPVAQRANFVTLATQGGP
jgi:hypothetical protein